MGQKQSKGGLQEGDGSTATAGATAAAAAATATGLPSLDLSTLSRQNSNAVAEGNLSARLVNSARKTLPNAEIVSAETAAVGLSLRNGQTYAVVSDLDDEVRVLFIGLQGSDNKCIINKIKQFIARASGDARNEDFRALIQSRTLWCAQQSILAARSLNIRLYNDRFMSEEEKSEYELAIETILSATAAEDLTAELGSKIAKFCPSYSDPTFSDSIVAHLLERKDQSEIPFEIEAAEYFISNVKRIAQGEAYVPSDEDVAMYHTYFDHESQSSTAASAAAAAAASGWRGLASAGVALQHAASELHSGSSSASTPPDDSTMMSSPDELVLTYSKQRYHIYSVEKDIKRWLPQYAHVDFVIFAAPIGDYDHVVSRMETLGINASTHNLQGRRSVLAESLDLFTYVANHELFAHTPVIVLFTKYDTFERKIQDTDMICCFSDYTDGCVPEAAISFLNRKFYAARREGTALDDVYINFVKRHDENCERVANNIGGALKNVLMLKRADILERRRQSQTQDERQRAGSMSRRRTLGRSASISRNVSHVVSMVDGASGGSGAEQGTQLPQSFPPTQGGNSSYLMGERTGSLSAAASPTGSPVPVRRRHYSIVGISRKDLVGSTPSSAVTPMSMHSLSPATGTPGGVEQVSPGRASKSTPIVK